MCFETYTNETKQYPSAQTIANVGDSDKNMKMDQINERPFWLSAAFWFVLIESHVDLLRNSTSAVFLFGRWEHTVEENEIMYIL